MQSLEAIEPDEATGDLRIGNKGRAIVGGGGEQMLAPRAPKKFWLGQNTQPLWTVAGAAHHIPIELEIESFSMSVF